MAAGRTVANVKTINFQQTAVVRNSRRSSFFGDTRASVADHKGIGLRQVRLQYSDRTLDVEFPNCIITRKQLFSQVRIELVRFFVLHS